MLTFNLDSLKIQTDFTLNLYFAYANTEKAKFFFVFAEFHVKISKSRKFYIRHIN